MRSEEFDELFRDEINGLEGLPQNVSWSKEAGWKKLNAQLTGLEGKKAMIPFWPAKKILTSYWGYAAAAIVTLMLVSVYSVKSYWAVIEEQPGMDAVATTSDHEQTDASSSQKDHGILEKSISFNENLNEMSADEIKNGINPFLITDPTLKNQLLIYNSFTQPHVKTNPDLFPAFFSRTPDFQLNAKTMMPLPANNWIKPGFEPQPMPVAVNNHSAGLTAMDAVKNAPLALVIRGNLAAVDQSFNFGVEGNILFKLPDVNGKNNAIGVGLDSRYQFYTAAENNKALDNLNGADDSNIRNGFNTFVTASYSRNLSKKEKKPFWVGMKVGYLVHDNTNNFDDKTLMLEMIVGGNDSSKFKVSPQMYLTDNLKRVMPGIKLGMTLGKFEKDVSM